MRKDLKLILRNRMVWMPIVVVPVMLLVVMPAILVGLPSFLDPSEFATDDLGPMLENMPEAIRSQLTSLSDVQQYLVLASSYMFAPMFLIVPLMVSSVLAADSFAGEKERKTLEGLLYTPITDGELFLAKLLVGFVPALVVELGSFMLYGLVVNLTGYRIMGRIYFPTANWWPLVFWVGPAVSVAGLGTTVLISSKAKTFMQAQQAGGLLVLPIVFLMVGQLAGLFFLNVGLLLIAGALVWLLGIWLIWIGARTFARGELITRV